MEDWDLQAVVRGCSSSCDELSFSNNLLNSPLDFDEILRFCDDQQNELFGYNNFATAQSNLSRSCPSSTCLMSVVSCCEDQVIKEEHKLQKQHSSSSLSDSCHNRAASSSLAVIKSKKSSKKNKQKRVVKQVAEDDKSSDKWAWRKYGQKPIKGSPYPRSYYRCSSLKGCMARKQVERSKDDPSLFIITYTAEHTHPFPTRRNSLAGTTRLKDPNSAKLPDPKLIKHEIPNASMDNHVITTVKNEQLEDEDEDICLPDMIFSDDLFPSLDDFDGLKFD